MTPQDILNAQYTAPDMPDVSQVAEAMRTVREHVARNKTPYALLAASLPVVGYGVHRALRKTPEADPEPTMHTQQASVEMPQIQQGSDKIAEAVMARFGLTKTALTAWQRMLDAGGATADAIRKRMPAGPMTIKQMFGTPNANRLPQEAAEALAGQNLAHAHTMARAMEPLNRTLQTRPGYMSGGLRDMRAQMSGSSTRSVAAERDGLTRQWESRQRSTDAWRPSKYDSGSADATWPQLQHEHSLAKNFPGVRRPLYPEGALPSLLGKTSSVKVAWNGANVVKGVGTALGALGGGYGAWKGTEGDNIYDRVVRTGAGAVGGGAVGYGLGHAATKVPGMLRGAATAPTVPGAQQAYDTMRGSVQVGGGHVPSAPQTHAPLPTGAALQDLGHAQAQVAPVAQPKPGVQPPGVRAAPPVGPPRKSPPPVPSQAKKATPPPVPPQAQAPTPHVPSPMEQREQSIAAGQTPRESRAALGDSLESLRNRPKGGPYYADREAMMNDGYMQGHFKERAGKAYDSGLVPNESSSWSMAHQLHSMSPEEHASALSEFHPDDWEHKLLTHMGPLVRPPRAT